MASGYFTGQCCFRSAYSKALLETKVLFLLRKSLFCSLELLNCWLFSPQVLWNFIPHSVAATKYAVGLVGALRKPSQTAAGCCCLFAFDDLPCVQVCIYFYLLCLGTYSTVKFENYLGNYQSQSLQILPLSKSILSFWNSFLSYVRLSNFTLCHIFHFFPILGCILDTFLRCLFQFPNILSTCWVQVENLFQ